MVRYLEGFRSCVRGKKRSWGGKREVVFGACVSVVGGREGVVSGAER